MQGEHLFEYATLRVVPKVEREEFINIGVILYCPGQKFLQCIIELNEKKIQALCCDIDIDELKANMQSFEKICKGGNDAGPIGKLSMAERFRWLTATRSTILQTSKVHPGLCQDAFEILQHLHKQLVQ
jgi:hypothetical protein